VRCIAFATLCSPNPLHAVVANIWCDRAYQRDVAQRGAEARLYIAMGSGILLPIGD